MKVYSQLIASSIMAILAASAPASDANPPATQPVQIRIENFKFSPETVTIAPGTTVTWINADDVPHTATEKGESPSFDSKTLDTDDKYSFTFTKPGTYAYYCKVHTHMTGTVIVK